MRRKCSNNSRASLWILNAHHSPTVHKSLKKKKKKATSHLWFHQSDNCHSFHDPLELFKTLLYTFISSIHYGMLPFNLGLCRPFIICCTVYSSYVRDQPSVDRQAIGKQIVTFTKKKKTFVFNVLSDKVDCQLGKKLRNFFFLRFIWHSQIYYCQS